MEHEDYSDPHWQPEPPEAGPSETDSYEPANSPADDSIRIQDYATDRLDQHPSRHLRLT